MKRLMRRYRCDWLAAVAVCCVLLVATIKSTTEEAFSGKSLVKRNLKWTYNLTSELMKKLDIGDQERRKKGGVKADDTFLLEEETGCHFPFRYLINEEDACKSGKVTIINLIPTAVSHKNIRDRIRKLWANSEHLSQTQMKTLFVLGQGRSNRVQTDIEQESNTFHDIIQLGFTDSYSNLTLKTLSILHWSATYCPTAKWILKSDDDVFVNSFRWKPYLLNHAKYKDFVCRMNDHLQVCRPGGDCNQKWAVSKYEYPNNTYPDYCDGPAYAMKASIASKIYKRACGKRPHTMEDAYFTGILATGLKPKFLNLSGRRFRKNRRRVTKYWDGEGLLVRGLGVNNEHLNFDELWKKIIKENITPQVNKERTSHSFDKYSSTSLGH